MSLCPWEDAAKKPISKLTSMRGKKKSRLLKYRLYLLALQARRTNARMKEQKQKCRITALLLRASFDPVPGVGSWEGRVVFPFLRHDMLQASFALSKLWICVRHNPPPRSGQGTEPYKFPSILPWSALVLRETLKSINISKVKTVLLAPLQDFPQVRAWFNFLHKNTIYISAPRSSEVQGRERQEEQVFIPAMLWAVFLTVPAYAALLRHQTFIKSKSLAVLPRLLIKRAVSSYGVLLQAQPLLHARPYWIQFYHIYILFARVLPQFQRTKLV